MQLQKERLPPRILSSAANLFLSIKRLPVSLSPFRPVPGTFLLTSKSARKSSTLDTLDQPLCISWDCTCTSLWSPGLWQPFQRLQPLGGFYCARASDADHEASACGSSPCFGAAHRPSHLSWLGSAYWHDSVPNRPTASHTTEINLAADEFVSDNPHRCGYHGMHVPGA